MSKKMSIMVKVEESLGKQWKVACILANRRMGEYAGELIKKEMERLEKEEGKQAKV